MFVEHKHVLPEPSLFVYFNVHACMQTGSKNLFFPESAPKPIGEIKTV
jgi:hypothetical protein